MREAAAKVQTKSARAYKTNFSKEGTILEKRKECLSKVMRVFTCCSRILRCLVLLHVPRFSHALRSDQLEFLLSLDQIRLLKFFAE